MIVVERLNKTFAGSHGQGAVPVLRDVSFSVAAAEFYVLLGASGCGKTTTLRSLAGLDRPERGTIAIDGRTVFASPGGIYVGAENRPIAMVFQSYGLWPHMNVRDNILFPLRYGNRRVAPKEAQRRLDRVLALLRLTEYADRPIFLLSGGQQQRVALSRALALEPALLLMDEPLSNLDAKLRARLRVELKELVRSVGITTVYVTHDQAEAMVMGDRIAVMHAGRILQEGTGIELYQRPQSLAAARFLGEMNFLQGRVSDIAGGTVRVRIANGLLTARAVDTLAVGDAVEVGIRPEDIRLADRASDDAPRARVVSRYYLGDGFTCECEIGDRRVTVRLPKSDNVEPGTHVHLRISPEQCIAFARRADEDAGT